MIGLQLNGRLGNQLFQHAFAYRLLHEAKRHVALIAGDDAPVVCRYFDTSGGMSGWWGWLSRLTCIAPRFVRRSWVKRARARGVLSFDNNLEPAANLAKLPTSWAALDGRLIEGFFQSVEYFTPRGEDARMVAQRLFRVRTSHARRFRQVYGGLFGDGFVVAVHLRRGDYVAWDGGGYLLPTGYFHEAMAQARLLAPEGLPVRFLLLSDDIAWVRSEFIGADFVYLDDPRADEIVDMQALMHADVVVTSNSSFSWWGAWLNVKSAPVISPKRWLGHRGEHEYPKGIFPPGWIQLER